MRVKDRCTCANREWGAARWRRRGDGKQDEIVPLGGGGFDKINVADGDKLDTANGGKGRDLCIVDARKEAGTSCATVQVQRP